MPHEILTPPGRIVWGHPLKPQAKKYMDGPNKGQDVKDASGNPVMQWSFGLAIRKEEFGPIWAAMQAEAMTGYPNGVPQRFSWKIKDCDQVDDKGKLYREREGYAGCYVITISSANFAPAVYKFENGVYRQLTEKEFKTGDWMVAKLSFAVNVATGTNTPSLYVNPQALEIVGYDKEIVTAGVNPMEAFGGRQYQLPPGVSATPISGAPADVGMPGAPGPGQMPPAAGAGYPMPGQPPQGMPMGMPGQQQPMQPGPGYGAPQGAPMGYGAPQGQMPPPARDFVTNAGQQQPMQPGPGYGAPQGAPMGYPGQPPQGYAPAPQAPIYGVPTNPGQPPMQPGYGAPQGAPMGMPGQMPPR